MGPRRNITISMFGDGIFNQEGTAWRHSRDILVPQFLYQYYRDLDVLRNSVDDLIDIVSTARGVVDLQALFFRLTLDVTTAFLFGESVQSLKAPKSTGEETFADAFNTAQTYVARRFRLLDLYWLIGEKKFTQACDRVRHFADQIIDRNLAQDEEQNGNDFLKSVNKNMADRPALRGQIINILVAGRDTTACLLSWTL